MVMAAVYAVAVVAVLSLLLSMLLSLLMLMLAVEVVVATVVDSWRLYSLLIINSPCQRASRESYFTCHTCSCFSPTTPN